MPSVNVNVLDQYKKVKKIYFKKTDLWKKIKKGYVKVNGNWKKIFSEDALPIGIILPYDTNDPLPSNFEEYTLANDKLILGASETFDLLSTGGNSEISVSITSSTNGSHTGDTYDTFVGSYINNQAVAHTTKYASGAHNHTFSATKSDVIPSSRSIRLIKATDKIEFIPKNVCCLGITNLENLIEQEINKFLISSSFNGSEVGNDTVSITGVTSIAGSHSHTGKGVQGGGGSVGNRYLFNQGAHNHTISLSGNINLKHKYLSLWKHATENVEIGENQIIGMWENDIPPEGWVICNGLNGSPDMRDYFLKIGSSEVHGNSNEGSASINLTATSSVGGSHQHDDTYDTSSNIGGGQSYHNNNVAMSGHTFAENIDYIPPYYALNFIMKQIN